MGGEFVVQGIAQTAHAVRRLGVARRVQWVKPLVRPFLRTLTVELGGLSLSGDLDHWELLDQLRQARFEPETVSLFKEMVQPGHTVVDIGACIGYYSLLGAKGVGPRGQVFAFEPDAHNFRRLMNNIRRNRLANITPVQKAVSDSDGDVTLFVHKLDPTQNSLYPTGSDRERIRVESVSLDHFLRGTTVDVIKIDIEGGELQALRGMTNVLRRSPRAVLFLEVNPSALRRAGASEQDLMSWLEARGFRTTVLDPRWDAQGSLIAKNVVCHRETLA